MSQYPPIPFDPAPSSFQPGPGPAPYQSRPAGGGSRVWLWVLGAIGLLGLTPCLCCLGGFAYIATFKEFELNNGQHMGGNPMNVQFDYHIKGDGRGPSKAYYIVCRTADGVVREQNIRGPFIDTRGTFRFFA